MGCASGPLLCVDSGAGGGLPHCAGLPAEGDQEVQEEAEQGRQEGGAC